MEISRKESEGGWAKLGLWDATSIIVGIIIGVGIFEVPREVFRESPSPFYAILAWTVGGILAMVGALCFAELAGTYPHSGGEYIYLTRAFGSLTGFLYGWAQLAVIRPACIGGLGYIFAIRARDFVPLDPLLLAAVAVIVLTVINILGATLGATTQNFLTAFKLLSLATIVLFGLFRTQNHVPVYESAAVKSGWFAGVMIMVLWTYAGWNEAAYIAAEVKDSRRNVPLSLIFGTLTVTVIYLLVNGAVLVALGFDGARTSKPADLLGGGVGGKVVNLMIMISALGAMNGMTFTTARIYQACGQDHRLFKSLSHWSSMGAPVRALAIQGVVNLGYLLGTAWASKGPEPASAMAVSTVGLLTSDQGPMLAAAALMAPNQPGFDFGTMKGLTFWIDLTAPVFWFFFLLTGISVLVLRGKDPDAPRPFRTPFYPLLPILFCCWCAYMVAGSVLELPSQSFFGFLVLLAGLPLYFLPKKKKKAHAGQEREPLIGVGRHDEKLSG